MRAVVFDRHGPPEVLTVADLPDPQPGPGQVRIRVRAGGVQPFDTQVRAGTLPVEVRFPQQLGNEFAGVVDQLGPGIADRVTGDEVLGWAHMASLAEYVIADADAVAVKPASMPWEVAGALGASGQTALTALRTLGVTTGDALLVHAAAGSAGSAAVQIARQRGATVLGSASAANHDYLTSLGAVPVSYGPGMVGRVRDLAPLGVDAVLDAVGGPALEESLTLVADRRRIATLVDHERAQHLGVPGVRATRSLQQLRELIDLHERGALQVLIRSRFALEEIAEAHHEVETGHGRGKVVIVQP